MSMLWVFESISYFELVELKAFVQAAIEIPLKHYAATYTMTHKFPFYRPWNKLFNPFQSKAFIQSSYLSEIFTSTNIYKLIVLNYSHRHCFRSNFQ